MTQLTRCDICGKTVEVEKSRKVEIMSRKLPKFEGPYGDEDEKLGIECANTSLHVDMCDGCRVKLRQFLTPSRKVS